MNLSSRFALLAILFLSAGCAANIHSDIAPNIHLKDYSSIYVYKQSRDRRGLDSIIAAKLNELGFKATSGGKGEQSYDAFVRYEDRWMWDITNYMISIRIDFMEPDTDFVFASGSSFRSSLKRKPPEFMINEVLRDMMGKDSGLPSTVAEQSRERMEEGEAHE